MSARFTSLMVGLILASIAVVGPLDDTIVDAADPIDGGARATADAIRDVPWRPGVTCDLATVQALSTRHPGVRQFVVVATSGFGATSGTVFAAVLRIDGTWACQTPELSTRVGRSGTRPLADRRSGDGSTPAGVFPLGTTTGWDGQRFSTFGNSADPGVRSTVTYRRVRPEDCWGATAGTASYNRLVNRPNCPGPDDEWLPRFGDVYSHAAVIGANLDPISGDQPGEPPLAAAIFLHRHSYTTSGATKATSGCVSLDTTDLVTVVRLLDPALRPHFAIGPTEWLRTTA